MKLQIYLPGSVDSSTGKFSYNFYTNNPVFILVCLQRSFLQSFSMHSLWARYPFISGIPKSFKL